jgi:hypothetical protein
MGRPHTLDADPERLDLFVEMLAEGCTRQQIADAFGSGKRQITEWKKRPDVQAKLIALIRERANGILSHTDTRIQKLLESGKEIPTRDLLEIRRTYATEAAVAKTGNSEEQERLIQTLQELHDNPDFARKVADLEKSSEQA